LHLFCSKKIFENLVNFSADASKPKRQLNMCLPPGSGILVYHSREQSSKGDKTVEVIQFAFSNRSLKGIELHTWQLQEGIISSYKIRNILNQDFRRMAIQYQLSTIGATTNSMLFKNQPFFLNTRGLNLH